MSNPSSVGDRSDRIFRSNVAGPPASGKWLTGDVCIDANGTIHRCLMSGRASAAVWESDALVIDEVVSLAGNAAKFKAMAGAVPAGAIILGVQLAITTLVVGGGTTVKVGLGLNGSDPDAYGLTGALTKNSKAQGNIAPAVLSGATTLEVCACATAGGIGDTNLTAGAVRVRITYKPAPVALPSV